MSKKILIIDDEHSMVTYLSTLLQDHGYETSSSLEAEAGLQKAIEESPDLITLDILMPDKTGIRLYRDLKKNEQVGHIPVIVVTGFTAEQHPMIDLKKFIYERKLPGPEGFIEKPVDPDVLLSAISSALEGTAQTSV